MLMTQSLSLEWLRMRVCDLHLELQALRKVMRGGVSAVSTALKGNCKTNPVHDPQRQVIVISNYEPLQIYQTH